MPKREPLTPLWLRPIPRSPNLVAATLAGAVVVAIITAMYHPDSRRVGDACLADVGLRSDATLVQQADKIPGMGICLARGTGAGLLGHARDAFNR
ncbi:MAG: hypothetical protein AB7G06_04485 [Bdellovibrionales bacterium]